jgi:hypothetical protein
MPTGIKAAHKNISIAPRRMPRRRVLITAGGWTVAPDEASSLLSV